MCCCPNAARLGQSNKMGDCAGTNMAERTKVCVGAGSAVFVGVE